MATVISLDIGTTKLCGVALDPAGPIAEPVEIERKTAVPNLPEGHAEQDPALVRESAFEILRKLAPQAPDLAAIGLTGQMHGMLAVDSANRPLTNLITWQDRRCLEPAPGGGNYLGLMRRRAGDQAWECCGCEPASGYLGSTLFWLCQTKTLPPATARVSFIPDWIGGLLTGQLPVTDPTDAGSAGIFDLVRMRWNVEIAWALGLPAHLLPPVRPAGEIIGHVTPEIAAATGLRAGTPVCNGLGDSAASFVGSVADTDRSLLLNLGTGGQISWAVPEFTRVPGMETRYLPSFTPGATAPHRYALVGASLCGGRAYAWLRDVVRDWLGELAPSSQAGAELKLAAAASDGAAYTRLNDLAAGAPPGCAGLRFATTLAGTRLDPARRGSLTGISLENFTLGNLARAVLEGMVEELCEFYDHAAGNHAKSRLQTVVASGNAIRRNPVLRQIIADRLNRPLLVPRHLQEAAYGAALLAGSAVGVWPSLAEARRFVRYSE
jgi:sugar (pentulose or hexulose) kinase